MLAFFRLCALVAIGAVCASPVQGEKRLLTDTEIEAMLATISVPEGESRPTVADFRSAVVATRDGQRLPTLDEFRDFYEWTWVPKRLAKGYYPDLFAIVETPENLYLGFVLKDKDTVITHASGVVQAAAGMPLVKVVEALIPELSKWRVVDSGAQCFLPEAGRHGKFCVAYALVR